jgi:hypothetical protein
MFRALPAVAGLLLLIPAIASAAPFGEVPFRATGKTEGCLRATGLPGEIVRDTSRGAQFLQAGPGGLTRVAEVASGARIDGCPEAAARPGGAGVLAFATRAEIGGEGRAAVRVALREPGASWGALAEVASVQGEFAGGVPLAVDVSSRGDALVAFAQRDERGRVRVRAVRRGPGAGFGTAQTLTPAAADEPVQTQATTSGGELAQARVAAGLTASGEAVVAWSVQPVAGRPRELWVAIAPAGAAFGTPVKLGPLRGSSPFSLAVGAGGNALLAFVSGDDVRVAERAPGAAFGPSVRVGEATDAVVTVPAAALRDDGGAVVAWANLLAGDVHAILRTRSGPFGAPVGLSPRSGFRYPRRVRDLLAALDSDDPGEFNAGEDDGGNPRVTFTPDGRVLATWSTYARRGGVWWFAPRAALIGLAGGRVENETLGSELRDAASLTAVTTAAGVPAVAWTDDGDDRLRLALEGVRTVADVAPPKVTVLEPARRVLKADEPLRLGIRCARACDVRVQVGDGPFAANETFTLRRAGVRRLELQPAYAPVATLRGGPVTVRVRYGTPGARHAAARSVTYRLRRLPDVPRPKVLDAVAHRAGDRIELTWRTDRDAKASDFYAYATRTRTGTALESLGLADVRGGGRRFRATVQDDGSARYVQIVATVAGARKYDTIPVRVRG